MRALSVVEEKVVTELRQDEVPELIRPPEIERRRNESCKRFSMQASKQAGMVQKSTERMPGDMRNYTNAAAGRRDSQGAIGSSERAGGYV
jgi:hypothetical protein